jgi:thiol-disulfide isomerase/thioredoxin
MKKLFLIFLAVFLGLSAIAQSSKGFELTVKIDGYPKDEQLRLGRYYGDKTLFIPEPNAAVFDEKRSVFVFKRDEPLEGGRYMLISFENTPAELIIDQNQQFSIEMKYPFDATNIANMKFRNSAENQVNADFDAKVRPFYQEFDTYRKEYEALSEEEKKSADALIKKIQTSLENIEKIKTQFMEENPKHLMTAVFRAQKPVEVPEAPDHIPENERQQWRYNYWKDHFFDNFDLTNSLLLFTPLFHTKLIEYLEKVLQPFPDSLKFGIERLIEKTRQAPELFKYTIITTVNRYMQSQIIGYDAICVYLAEKYYLSGDAFWASEASIESFQKYVDRTKPLLIGTCPIEFLCPDTTITSSMTDYPWNSYRSVFSPKNRYTVVIFWEANCGHCKKQMPLLRDLYNAKRKELDFEVFAVGRDHDVDKWKKAIYEYDIAHWVNVNGKASNVKYDDLWDVHNTPTIYILDSQKRIVTKRIEVESIEPLIRDWNARYYDGK